MTGRIFCKILINTKFSRNPFRHVFRIAQQSSPLPLPWREGCDSSRDSSRMMSASAIAPIAFFIRDDKIIGLACRERVSFSRASRLKARCFCFGKQSRTANGYHGAVNFALAPMPGIRPKSAMGFIAIFFSSPATIAAIGCSDWLFTDAANCNTFPSSFAAAQTIVSMPNPPFVNCAGFVKSTTSILRRFSARRCLTRNPPLSL